MNAIVAAVQLILALTLFALPARAGEPPVTVSHQMTRFEQGAETSSIEFRLHVVNSSGNALSDLTLRVFRSPGMLPVPAPLNVGSLAAGGSADLTLKVSAPAAVTRERLARQPLFFGGRCVKDGTLVEFPARSNPGGGL